MRARVGGAGRSSGRRQRNQYRAGGRREHCRKATAEEALHGLVRANLGEGKGKREGEGEGEG